jgi:hypothetical protein
MARRVFYSFHYVPDNWRAAQIRNSGIVEGNVPATDNDWETVKRGGETAIQRWIDSQLDGKSCAVVLIGNGTAGRKWINYEIEKSWNSGKGIFGVYVHNLKDANSQQAVKGRNPFDGFTIKNGTVSLSSVVRCYDPPFGDSKQVYTHISQNLSSWIEEAINIRSKY